MYCNGSLMWSREIKHTKRCKTERKNVADIGSYHTKRKRECWYRTCIRRRRAESTNNNAQRYGPKALIRRANDGRKDDRQQESAMHVLLLSCIWADPICLPLRQNGVGIFSIPKFLPRQGADYDIQTCNYKNESTKVYQACFVIRSMYILVSINNLPLARGAT